MSIYDDNLLKVRFLIAEHVADLDVDALKTLRIMRICNDVKEFCPKEYKQFTHTPKRSWDYLINHVEQLAELRFWGEQKKIKDLKEEISKNLLEVLPTALKELVISY